MFISNLYCYCRFITSRTLYNYYLNWFPCLVITHIEKEWFKSCADKQVLGPFHKSFTSIVGPNGSGKSNVIDSMLFVFGYKAAKIRFKKLSVLMLIHNSSTHPNQDWCRVAIHFQEIIDRGGEEAEVVPNTQFSVARTDNKDRCSYYSLDKEAAKMLCLARLSPRMLPVSPSSQSSTVPTAARIISSRDASPGLITW